MDTAVSLSMRAMDNPLVFTPIALCSPVHAVLVQWLVGVVGLSSLHLHTPYSAQRYSLLHAANSVIPPPDLRSSNHSHELGTGLAGHCCS